MALIKQPLKSIKPQAGTLCQGIGNGSGSTLTGLFKMGTGAAQMFDYRSRADTASGSDARIIYARMHQYGAGGGEAIRAYAFAQNAATATTGTLNGIHATMSIATSSAISGAGQAIRATLEAAAASRTLGGTIAALNVDSNIGTGNTLPADASFIRVTNTGSVSLAKLLNLPAVASGGMVAAHTTDAMTHSVRCITGSTVVYLMATTTATNRTGGA
jgi:hypothetical protein